jgi:hypothetical protein
MTWLEAVFLPATISQASVGGRARRMCKTFFGTPAGIVSYTPRKRSRTVGQAGDRCRNSGGRPTRTPLPTQPAAIYEFRAIEKMPGNGEPSGFLPIAGRRTPLAYQHAHIREMNRGQTQVQRSSTQTQRRRSKRAETGAEKALI